MAPGSPGSSEPASGDAEEPFGDDAGPDSERPADHVADPHVADPHAADPDAAWRAIIDNYGDRAQLDEEPTDQPPPPPVDQARLRRLFEPLERAPRGQQTPGDGSGDTERPDGDLAKSPDAPFVPPEPPPVPRTTGDRRAAWAGVLGAPAVLLVCLVLSLALPTLVVFGLVAAFVVGFCYLVVQMPRGPRDPGDDGARL